MQFVWRSRLDTDGKGYNLVLPVPAACRYTHALARLPSRSPDEAATHTGRKVVLSEPRVGVAASHVPGSTTAPCKGLRSRWPIASSNLSPARSPRWPRELVRAGSGVLLSSHHSLVLGGAVVDGCIAHRREIGLDGCVGSQAQSDGLGAILPWCAGWRWPHPSLVALRRTLLASPLVDFDIDGIGCPRSRCPRGSSRTGRPRLVGRSAG